VNNAVRHQTLRKIQRFLAIISFTMLLGIVLVAAQQAGYELPSLRSLVPVGLLGDFFNRRIAIVSGHAGYDSGAICTGADGEPTVTEQAINGMVAQRLAARLRRRGAMVDILNEFDPSLVDLKRDLLISLHADSCIEASGYKIAYTTRAEVLPQTSRLDQCFAQDYEPITGLATHLDTITHDMTDYHAFRAIAPTTPAVILEMGFIGGDQDLLVNRPDTVARGIQESIRCFFQAEDAPE
jgi:N-acetylmuramoyl-L-alanine amidase